MKAKFTFPYVLTGLAVLMTSMRTNGTPGGDHTTDKNLFAATRPVGVPDNSRSNADSTYVDFALAANINSANTAENENATVPTMRAVAVQPAKYDVIYVCDNGAKIKRKGGTRAWRNNNPGCIRYSKFSREIGAIGSAGGFAVFPDEKTGMDAICKLLKSDKYKNLTISSAIFKYAPPHENNTHAYKKRMQHLTGLSIQLKICDLTDEQLQHVAKAIRVIEGWKPGHEVQMDTLKLINNVEIAQRGASDSILYARNIMLNAMKKENQRTL